MNFLKTPEFRVGLFVLLVSIVVGAMSIMASDDQSGFGKTHKLTFKVNDASGLIKKSAVKMAGINVGVIKGIKLDHGIAYLELAINSDIDVPENTKIEIRANGILGDKYIELVPGDFNGPMMAENTEIKNVTDNGSMAGIMNQLGKISNSVATISDALKSATTGDGDTSSPIGRIIKNLETLTGDLAELSSGKKEKIKQIVDNIQNITSSLDNVVNSQDGDGIKDMWARANRSIARLDKVMKNIEEISDKINSGKGTIGKLINDEKTVDQINTAVESVNELVGGLKKIETGVDFHTEYLAEQKLSKSYLGVKIQPGLDRYYELAVIDDPKGIVETIDTSSTANFGSSTQSTTVTRDQKTYKNKFKFTALFAKNFYDFTIKAGMMETTAGAGLDYFLYRRKIRWSIEALNFSSLHVRTFLRYNFYRGFYLIGGGDDLMQREAYSTYVGAGLFLTNDDLKMLFGSLK